MEANGGASNEVKWNLEILRQKSGEIPSWKTLYSFSEDEFYLKDFEAASFAVSKMPIPQGLFWCNIVAVKVFLLEDYVPGHSDCEQDQSAGLQVNMSRMILIGRELKRSTGADVVLVRTLRNEAERINILRDIFGITVDDDAARHIVGRAAAI